MNLLQMWPLGLRLLLFRGLELLTAQRSGGARVALPGNPPAHGPAQPSLWLFVSTIGELNAIEPLLQQVLQALGQPPLTLLSDREVYAEAYRARFPQARLVFLQGGSAEALALARTAPPLMCVVAEIPALLHDAPCRMSFALVKAARDAGAPVVLVNGWGYGYAPPSRMDAIERALFNRDYLRSFDLLLVQTEAFASQLIAQGAAADRVQVVGNIKFDAMDTGAWAVGKTRSPRLLQSLLDAGRPTIVAGCVTDADEQQRVLDAFASLRSQAASALLVLAPRHPENPVVMQTLQSLLQGRGLPFALRSALGDAPLDDNIAVLVLDTMGELRDFYAAAHVAHVGVDHNVLEPLGFGKPVSVSPGWNATYPSYPVYALLQAQQGLLEAADAGALTAAWTRCIALGGAQNDTLQRSRQALAQAKGATQRHMLALAPWLARARRSAAG